MTQNGDITRDWQLIPERLLSTDEVGGLLGKAEELWILGQTKKQKVLVRDAFLIQTAIMTGLRAAEICSLKVSDLRIGNGQSHFRVVGKGRKERVVHIGREYKRILKRYIQWKLDNGELHPEAHLLRSERSDRYSPGALWRRWKKYCPKTLHAARHANATLLYAASNHNLRAVQRQLGHSRITTTQIYADVMPEVMRESMSAMERLATSTRKQVSQSLAVAEPAVETV